ncbi:MAG: hypothetical protein M3N53_12810 [Actinomycetota bacterium]|nr:hypothetical protein [Actinomycetota bacterium]
MAKEDRADRAESTIFRPEALQHRARQSGPGAVVRVAPPWTTAAFYVLVLVFLAALVAVTTIEIERYARGPVGSDEEGRVVVLVPAAAAGDVAAGQRVDLGGSSAQVVSSGESAIQPPQVRTRYGVDVATASVAVITSAETSSTTSGSGRILVEREPVIVSLVPGLSSLFGDGDA